MLKVLPILLALLAVPVLAQEKVAQATPGSAAFLETRFWSELGKPTEGIRGYSLLTRNMQPRTDTLFEFWVRIVPTNAQEFNKRYGLPRSSAFVIQHATVDCDKRLVMLDKTAAYTDSNSPVDAKSSELIKSESKKRVTAGSVGDTIFQYVCLKLE